MPIFQLNGYAVLEMHEQQMEDIGALLHVQRSRQFATRVLPGCADNFAGMAVSTLLYLVRYVVYFEGMRTRTKVGYKRTTSGNSIDVTFIVEFS